MTRYLRQWQGQDVAGIECSGWYKAGEWTSFGIQVAEGGLGLYELGGKFALRKALAEGVEEFGDDAARAAKNCIMCFEAGTLVQTDKGLKSIERIRKGDRVLSYNEATGENEYQPVTQTFTRLATDVWQLKVEGERASIGVTSEHPFFVRTHGARSHTNSEGEWKQTWQIRAGDEIRLASGRWARVLLVLPKGEGRVYNFTVEKNHNYFIGNARLLTHNGDCTHFGNFDSARRDAFNKAGMNNSSEVNFSKFDPNTGTVVEFKGPNGAKVAYDSPHADMDALLGHDKPHVGYQSAGKRGNSGAVRGNNTYDGPQHPFRP